ncbi:MAG: tRNA (adenosine(37)-N6)-dimethylallyltransferase MiaA [Halanaerobiaceae bacterium]
MKYHLPVILGPTAVGKTGISLTVAKNLEAEIISADSMQIYRGMDIGTAKVDKVNRKNIPHHLIDIIDPDQEFSVADYQQKVDKIIPDIYAQNKIPIMVGGTGLYIQAVIEGFILPEMEKDEELRQNLRKEAKEYGNEYVHNKLKEIDPTLAEKLHPNDLRRVIRGIEIYFQTGKTKTYFVKKQAESDNRYRALKIGLKRNREELYRRINDRVDAMIEAGLIEEVKEIRENFNNISKTAGQALGYKEIFAYLEGDYSLQEAIRLIKRNTRHFAKRQITWFKRDENILWFNLTDLSRTEVINKITTFIKKFLPH